LGGEGKTSWPSLAVGDLDGDGASDALVSSHADVWLLRGDGQGGLLSPSRYWHVRSGEAALSLLLADLDGDGRCDLAVGAESGVDLLLGTGGGAPRLRQLAVPAESLASLRLDGDAKPDLVIGWQWLYAY